MRAFFSSLFGYFLSPMGLLGLAALDSSMLFFLPFAIDAAVILLTAREPSMAIVHAVLATSGSLIGAAVTFWIGRRAGEHGLERFVSGRRLEHIKNRVRRGGAIALAVPAFLPPPFPLTPFILACGALDVSRRRFFVTLGAARLVRFGVEAALAVRFGTSILHWMKSGMFQAVVTGLTVIAIVGTIVAVWTLVRQSRRAPARAAPRAA